MNLSEGSHLFWLTRFWTVTWKVVVFTLLWGVLTVPFIVPFEKKLKEFSQTHPLEIRIYYDLAALVVLMIASWVMMKFIEHNSVMILGFKNGHIFRDLLLGFLGGVFWLAIPLLTLKVLGWLKVQPINSPTLDSLLLTGVAMIFNVIAQEVLGRGYIFYTLEKNAGTNWTIFISAVIFMLYHFGAFDKQWLPALNVFMAGVLFAIAYKVSGNNLWLPIGLHFAWNFLLGPVFGLAISGQNQWNAAWQIFQVNGPRLLTGGSFGIEGGVLTLAATAIMIFVISFVYKAMP